MKRRAIAAAALFAAAYTFSACVPKSGPAPTETIDLEDVAISLYITSEPQPKDGYTYTVWMDIAATTSEVVDFFYSLEIEVEPRAVAEKKRLHARALYSNSPHGPANWILPLPATRELCKFHMPERPRVASKMVLVIRGEISKSVGKSASPGANSRRKSVELDITTTIGEMLQK